MQKEKEVHVKVSQADKENGELIEGVFYVTAEIHFYSGRMTKKEAEKEQQRIQAILDKL